MDITYFKLTVMFQEPFWIGLCERECGGTLEVCRIPFGAEPKDGEVYEFWLKNGGSLKFSPALSEGSGLAERRKSPKRLQREARELTRPSRIGTKAQQALKLQQEQGKEKRHALSKMQREAEEQRRFALRQEKRKDKHRGR